MAIVDFLVNCRSLNAKWEKRGYFRSTATEFESVRKKLRSPSNTSHFLHLLKTLSDALEVPLGYQDATGFHFGVLGCDHPTE